MSKPTETLLVHIFGDFNAGWMHYVMGREKPTDPVMAEGYDMGAETPSLQSMRRIMAEQNMLPAKVRQYKVKPAAPIPLNALWQIIESGSICPRCDGCGDEAPERGCFTCKGKGHVPITKQDFMRLASKKLNQ